MSIRQYEYALAVAEEGSVTAAAEKLRVAQPSISQQIRSLEKELGVELFVRTSRGLSLTVAGRAFVKEASIAVSAARRARAAATACSGTVAGELVVVVETGLGMCQLPRAIGELRRRYPRLEVTLYEESDPQAIDRLVRTGEADLVLSSDYGHYDPDATVIGDESYVVVLSEGHPLLTRKVLTLKELASAPWVRLRRGSARDDVITHALRSHSLSVSTVARASQLATAVKLASEGLGVTLIPASAVPPGYGHLARPLDPPVSHAVRASVRSPSGPAESALLDYLGHENWCGLDLVHA
ncbi:LysR family transcriptional regulator [Rhodococcus sp. 06-412-2C]|uniref:LysR family transcriptional regulator n=1 Tax=unclassified Rhodococcus (in: high G+C Gram-positive bacteria) TaxID=192944 RepID=UPI000B9B1EF3|nr:MULTISPECIES: LysR family transcriptional regulator [unclassified Rhodococcus (in: high G+C Gram-positive bacteria)]OZC87234.1 LysR family transcriptional regulator [Rhodococcus sp. 06-412-2C]OZD00674.1 LysR family transcriptional regulator [Rhodococcus sp. 06-412-2B]